MKKLLFLISAMLILTSINSFSQSAELTSLNKKREGMEQRKNVIIDSLKNLDIRINYLKTKITEIENSKPIKTITNFDAKIKNKPDVLGDIIGFIHKGDSLTVIKYFENGYWLVKRDSITGYTSEMYLVETASVKKIKSESGLVKEISSDETIDGAIRLYGNEDERSQFKTTDGYNAITLIWHCAKDHYRSITYTIGTSASYSYYKKDSEYVSDCAK
jgi:hypothetical protein